MPIKLSYKERLRLAKLFDEAHDQGSKEFLALWLRGNEKAIEAAQLCGFDYCDAKVKTLLSVVVLKVLRKANEFYAVLATKEGRNAH